MHIQSSAVLLNNAVNGGKSNISEICKKSLYGIITLAACALKVLHEKDIETAKFLARKLGKEMESTAILSISQEFCLKVDHFSNAYFSTQKSTKDHKKVPKTLLDLPALTEIEYVINQPAEDEILLSYEFEDIFFISHFIHFLTPNVPLINPGELEHPPEDRLPLIDKNHLLPVVNINTHRSNTENPHAKLMQNILSKKEKSWIYTDPKQSGDFRQLAYLDTSTEETKETPKIVSEHLCNINRSRSISGHRKFSSSPPPDPRLLDVVVKDREKLNLYRREALQRRNRHFMVEFSPMRGLDEGTNVKVDLVPIHPRYTSSNLGARYKTPLPPRTKRSDFVYSNQMSEISTPELTYVSIYNNLM